MDARHKLVQQLFVDSDVGGGAKMVLPTNHKARMSTVYCSEQLNNGWTIALVFVMEASVTNVLYKHDWFELVFLLVALIQIDLPFDLMGISKSRRAFKCGLNPKVWNFVWQQMAACIHFWAWRQLMKFNSNASAVIKVLRKKSLYIRLYSCVLTDYEWTIEKYLFFGWWCFFPLKSCLPTVR